MRLSNAVRTVWDAEAIDTSHLGFRSIQKIATIHASSGFIRGIQIERIIAMKYPIDDYSLRAKETFDSLVRTVATYTENAWRVGNALDTMFDYMFYFPQENARVLAVAKLALSRWKSDDIQKTMCWYDDFAWWGIASAKAFDDRYAHVFDSYRSEFQALAMECWTVVHSGRPHKVYKYKGVPNVWENRDEGSDRGYFTRPDTWAEPRYQGGTWQYEMFKDARPEGECSYKNPGDPKDPEHGYLGPFQLTLMQGLYMVLALRLRASGKGTEKAAEPVRGFLQNWFFDPVSPENKLLWDLGDRASVLVRERVSTYAPRDPLRGDFPAVQGYEKEEAWSGDQGLILGALLDYLQLHGSDRDAQSLPLKITSGVLSRLVKSSEDKVVVPATSRLLNKDFEDYVCGSGVFWRYLLHGFDQNPALRKEVLKLVAADRENNAIYKSAEDAYNGNSLGDVLFKDFNTLATLTAAIEILKSAET
jgi:hypothetical protein